MYTEQTCFHDTPELISSGVSEGRGSKTRLVILAVVDMVDSLEERAAEDEVEAFTAGRAQVRNDEVDAIGLPANFVVELTLSP